MADAHSQVLTLAEDGSLRLFDLRTHKCVQVIGRQGEARGGGCCC